MIYAQPMVSLEPDGVLSICSRMKYPLYTLSADESSKSCEVVSVMRLKNVPFASVVALWVLTALKVAAFY